MENPSSVPPAAADRPPRILWACPVCLLDTSSGAAMAVREMLLQLAAAGYQIAILGATTFDHPTGTRRLQGQWPAIEAAGGRMLALRDGALEHRVLVTASTNRHQMTSAEEGAWFAVYRALLDEFRPDLVFYYGGQPLDYLLVSEARMNGIPTAFYLANGNYTQARWCRDVDLVLTDSRATAARYQSTIGIDVTPIGAFIDPVRVIATERCPERILYVNPTLEKGAAIVICLALYLEERRPDLVFEVVESRGQWAAMLGTVSAALGRPRERLNNVVVTPNTSDMRPVYARARVLLAPSLWWESAGRVVVEALMNGIPAVVTDHGGMPEMLQDAGMVVKLPPECHAPPYSLIPAEPLLQPVVAALQSLYDDALLYADYVARARRVAETRHGLAASTGRLVAALAPLLARRAGDADAAARRRQKHRQGVDIESPVPVRGPNS